jgi:hypothetical protein
MRFVIGTIALLVLGSIFGSIVSVLLWPDVGSGSMGAVHSADTRAQPRSW